MDSQPLPPTSERHATEPDTVRYNPDQDPSEVKPAWYWIKDARGYGSVTVTMVFIAFWVTTLAYLVSIVDHLGSFTIRPFDVGASASYFIPLCTLYFSRKYTDAKFGTDPK